MTITKTYLDFAYQEIGIRETSGPGSNPRILEYHSATSLKATSDDVPWCSAFACWCMQQVGAKHPASAAARRWLDWGVPIVFPRIGCIAVMARGAGSQPPATVLDAPGHVGFFMGFSDRAPGGYAARILLLGGNQSNLVSIDSYSANLVLGYRAPYVPIMGD